MYRQELAAGERELGISGSGGAVGAYSAPCAHVLHPAGWRGSYSALGLLSTRLGGGGGARFSLDLGCDDEPRHFLDSCSLCKTPLGRNRDIYMYRGDMPFCSEECRQEQIEMDEAKEQCWNLSMKAAASRKDQQKRKSIKVRASGTTVAA